MVADTRALSGSQDKAQGRDGRLEPSKVIQTCWALGCKCSQWRLGFIPDKSAARVCLRALKGGVTRDSQINNFFAWLCPHESTGLGD